MTATPRKITFDDNAFLIWSVGLDFLHEYIAYTMVLIAYIE